MNVWFKKNAEKFPLTSSTQKTFLTITTHTLSGSGLNTLLQYDSRLYYLLPFPLPCGYLSVRGKAMGVNPDNRVDDNRPERRTALVTRELKQYNVDIAALSETRFLDKGELSEVGSGYTIFWSGRKSERKAGVGFAVGKSLVSQLESQPKGINDRIMTRRLPLQYNTNATLISAYAPTMTNPDDTKEVFYQQLNEVVRSVPTADRLMIILGDLNARIGSNHTAWTGIIGHHGIGQENSNGRLLLSLCSQHSLSVLNTFFKLKDAYKTTWMHPRSKHWHKLDFIICKQRDIHDFHITRAMRDPSVIEEIPERPLCTELDDLPTENEVEEAIKELQCGKAADPDGIPPEVFKTGGQLMVKKLTEFLCMCWEDGCLPKDLKDARIVHLYKGKGDKSSCDNYHGISLLSIAGKILCKVILNRLNTHLLDEIVPERQCGFRKNRGTVDMIFCATQIQEKCKEQNKDLYILFVDLTKAFDTVSHSGLWRILPLIGIPPKMVQIIRCFHDGMKWIG
ncbi:uncharacterized protein [Montipora foliosa]|uniref:uncharacterized protein n=1 Tax=Montipora foliosa TaxID=591990 RepID=UPI0035F1605B